jgi:hypothetical protein
MTVPATTETRPTVSVQPDAALGVAPGVVLGVVLYDGQYGFCSRWVKYWAGTLGRHGFETAALDERWVAERLKVPHEELITDIRLLTAGGQLISEPMSIYM